MTLPSVRPVTPSTTATRRRSTLTPTTSGAFSPTVTLNFGLRYEYTGEPLAATQLQSLNSISSVPGLITFGAPDTQKTNFMPRVGIAWAPDPNTSVHVGFAMANDVLYDNLGHLVAAAAGAADLRYASVTWTTIPDRMLLLGLHQLPGQWRSAVQLQFRSPIRRRLAR